MQHLVSLLNYNEKQINIIWVCVEICYYFSADDKACTFVGTAAYVPPEVLNSSPATVGWATFFSKELAADIDRLSLETKMLPKYAVTICIIISWKMATSDLIS